MKSLLRSPLRVAVLEADTPLDNTKKQYEGYGGVFHALLNAGGDLIDGFDAKTDLNITKYNVEVFPDKYPTLDSVDAVLITGSKHDSFANTPWILKLVEYTAKVLAQDRVRVIGVCFGHQIVGRAMGAKLGRNDLGWEAAVNNIELSDVGERVFGLKDTLRLHQMHRDIVFEYPEGVQGLGRSPVCEVQGMYTPKRLITLQGHPEFNEVIVREILESRHKMGVFDDEAFKAHLAKVALPHDGVIVGKAFIEFLLDE